MNTSRLFIQRPVATSLAMVAILLVGLLCYRFLPVSALPEVDYPTIQVVTFYPGASPDVMTSSVTAPLERQFGQMPGLAQMTSSSSGGASTITLQFSLDISLDVAEQEVQAAINAASDLLPTDLPAPPVYNKVNPADTPIVTLAITSETLPLPQLTDLVDTRLAQKLSQLPGVGLVSIGGGQRPAVRIRVNPTAIAANSLSLDDVRTAVTNANVNQAKGSFDGAMTAATVDGNDQLMSAADYRGMVVKFNNGAPLRLSDVAQVSDGAENAHLAAWANTTPAVILNVQRQPGANVIQVVDRIKRQLPLLQATLPGSVKVRLLTDRTVTIRASVADVQYELLLSVALVVMVIFLFLRNVPATIIPGVAVPLSLIGTFAVMYLAGFSINNLTLMALTIATGFVVDDAIVMIENIARFIEQGDPPMTAALKGSEQIGFTIISLTFSLIAVLIPLLFMGDVVGRIFREFAITLAVSILISAFVSLTLTPMMCSRLLRHVPEDKQGRFYHASGQFFERVIAGYGRMLEWVLDRQKLTLGVAIGTLVLTALLYVWVPKGFFPQQDTGAIQVITDAPQTVSFAAMEDRQQRLAAAMLQDPAVESLSSFIGVDGTNSTLNSGRMLVNLKPLDQRGHLDEILPRLQQRLASVAGVNSYLLPVQDLTIDSGVSRSQYNFILQASQPQDLATWTPLLIDRLRSSPLLQNVASNMKTSGLQAYVTIDRDTAARLGVTTLAVDNALYNAFGQRQISTIFTQSSQYRVILEQNSAQHGLAQLNDVYVPTTGDAQVPLSAIARIEERTTPLTIDHYGQFPSTTISFDLAPGASLGKAVDVIDQATRDIAMPASLQVHMQGAVAAFQNSLSNTLWLILAAVVTMYIVLGVLYESTIHPVTILSTLPSAGIGALLSLLLSGNDLGVVGIIGIVLLIGIVKKNAIMMIDFALDAERNQGLEPRAAIYQACLLRFRPILMTTMAALLSGLPLMIGTGAGSELRRPLGFAMVGGLALSQILTLYTTPVIYLYLERLQRFLAPKRRSRVPALAEKMAGIAD